jgi:hypothetical protein
LVAVLSSAGAISYRVNDIGFITTPQSPGSALVGVSNVLSVQKGDVVRMTPENNGTFPGTLASSIMYIPSKHDKCAISMSVYISF